MALAGRPRAVDPADPDWFWFDRHRFVLSNGHASVQYAVLHLTGYPLGTRDLKQQRQ
jgi:transketolase